MASPESKNMTSQVSENAATVRQTDSQMVSAMDQASSTRSSFLKKFPPDIRNEIYKLLLCSPLLAVPSADMHEEGEQEANHDEDQTSPIPPRAEFDLCPAILRTCRQIYEEWSVILYECNTFYFVCKGSWEWSVYHSFVGIAPLCPLYKRNYNPNVGRATGSLEDIPAVRKVRHWKVFLDAYDFEARHYRLSSGNTAHPSLPACFARTVSGQHLKSLELIVAPKEQPLNDYYLTPMEYLESFRTLRSERFNVIAGNRDNTPSNFFSTDLTVIFEDHLPDTEFLEEITALITGV